MNQCLTQTALCILCLGAWQSINAACITQPGFATVDIPMNVGRVVVRPSHTVGQILHTANFVIVPNGSLSQCDGSGSTIHAVLDKNPSLSPVGDSVYNTNIQGIGIRLYRKALEDDQFSGYYPYVRNLIASEYRLSPGYFVVEIIKTAAVTGSGAFSPGRYSSYSYRDNSVPVLTSTVYGNAITIASSSCEIQGNTNRFIELAPVTKADFKGVGTTLAEQAFNMTILCNGGENPSGYTEKNLISLSYGFTPEGSAQNVIKNIASDNNKAQGVSTQLLWEGPSKQVISNNDKFELGSVNSNQTVQYQVPMTARYYQSATNVTPGRVTGLATMTIQYD